LSLNGRMKEKSPTNLLMVDIADIKLPNHPPLPKPDIKLSMPEFLPRNNNLILKDKLLSSNVNILDTKLFQISDLELITTEKGLFPFWTEFSTILSQRLWSPPLIDFQDSRTISSNIFSKCSIPNSLLFLTNNLNHQQKNSPKILYPSLQFSPLDTIDKGNTSEINDDSKFSIARKFRFYPCKKMKKFLNKCFNVS